MFLLTATGDDLITLINRANSPFIRGIDAAAEYLGISRATLCRMKKNGQLDGLYCQIGKIVLFDRRKLDSICENKDEA